MNAHPSQFAIALLFGLLQATACQPESPVNQLPAASPGDEEQPAPQALPAEPSTAEPSAPEARPPSAAAESNAPTSDVDARAAAAKAAALNATAAAEAAKTKAAAVAAARVSVPAKASTREKRRMRKRKSIDRLKSKRVESTKRNPYGPSARPHKRPRRAISPEYSPYGHQPSRLRRHTVAPPAEVPTRRERYAHTPEADYKAVADDPRSTFSIDVDTASYSNIRRMLRRGQRPPVDAVRVEELINYFTYDYPQPDGDDPFALITEVGPAPWNAHHQLVHIGLQGRELEVSQLPGRNLVLLLDVSGSMRGPGRLQLLKSAFGMLVDQLDRRDRLSIVVYAGSSGVHLEPTRGDEHETIHQALDRLEAGGSTNGAAGLDQAYALAERSFIEGGINRVILASDGDFNVGRSSHDEMVQLVESKRDKGIFLTVLGVGMGNYNDRTMEQMADHGNGNYAYIDTIHEARKVLVRELTSTLVTIAKDTKLQVEFNPACVAAFRLIGYENRVLAHKDFANDTKDAGDLGAGHSVTALYEIVPLGAPDAATLGAAHVAPLKYQPSTNATARATGELLTVKLRFKEPTGRTSKLLTDVVRTSEQSLADTSQAYRFSAAVAGYGMRLRASKHIGDFDFTDIRTLARTAVGADRFGDRAEFLELVDAAFRHAHY